MLVLFRRAYKAVFYVSLTVMLQIVVIEASICRWIRPVSHPLTDTALEITVSSSHCKILAKVCILLLPFFKLSDCHIHLYLLHLYLLLTLCVCLRVCVCVCVRVRDRGRQTDKNVLVLNTITVHVHFTRFSSKESVSIIRGDAPEPLLSLIPREASLTTCIPWIFHRHREERQEHL